MIWKVLVHCKIFINKCVEEKSLFEGVPFNLILGLPAVGRFMSHSIVCFQKVLSRNVIGHYAANDKPFEVTLILWES